MTTDKVAKLLEQARIDYEHGVFSVLKQTEFFKAIDEATGRETVKKKAKKEEPKVIKEAPPVPPVKAEAKETAPPVTPPQKR